LIPVSTCPHASLPPRRLSLRAPIGLQSQGFIPIRRAGQVGVIYYLVQAAYGIPLNKR
jgi:hypothetical protein